MANGMKYKADRIIKNHIGGFDMPELRQSDIISRTKRIEATLRRVAKRDLIDSDRLLIER
jgi:hypothetical protein